MKGLIRFETTLKVGYAFESSEESENVHGYSVGFHTRGEDGFCEGQRVVVTVEALEEPSQ